MFRNVTSGFVLEVQQQRTRSACENSDCFLGFSEKQRRHLRNTYSFPFSWCSCQFMLMQPCWQLLQKLRKEREKETYRSEISNANISLACSNYTRAEISLLTVSKRRWLHFFGHAYKEGTCKLTFVVSYKTISAKIKGMQHLNGHNVYRSWSKLRKKYFQCKTSLCISLREVTAGCNWLPKDGVLRFTSCLVAAYYYSRQASHFKLSRECTRTVLAFLTFCKLPIPCILRPRVTVWSSQVVAAFWRGKRAVKW